jgi:hypothetical protein
MQSFTEDHIADEGIGVHSEVRVRRGKVKFYWIDALCI